MIKLFPQITAKNVVSLQNKKKQRNVSGTTSKTNETRAY
jgi:hypothetical protein